MRVTEHGGVLTIHDRPGCLWGLGLWFIAGGTLAISMLWVATNAHELAWWERVLIFLIGGGCVAGGLVTLRMAPEIVTVLDRARDLGRMRIRGLRTRELLEFRCRDVIVVEIHEEKDSDGDPCWQLRLGMKHGRALPLHSMHRHGRGWCEARQREIREYLGLA
jgi:hypothetical protein